MLEKMTMIIHIQVFLENNKGLFIEVTILVYFGEPGSANYMLQMWKGYIF